MGYQIGIDVGGTVYDGLALQPGNRLPGPAIVEQPTTTIVLPGDTVLNCDNWSNYELGITN